MQITRGDLDPDLELTLADATEGLLDFDDAIDVAVVGRRDGLVVFSRARSADELTTDGLGRIKMPWAAGDTADAGRITLAVIVQWDTGPQTINLDETVDIVHPASGAQFITIDDLVNHMSGVSLTVRQREAGRAVVAGCIGGLERRLYRKFAPAVVTETVRAGEDGWAPLARTPVQSIVSVDGLAYGGYRHSRNGVWLGHAHFGDTTVSYVGGFGEGEDLDDVRLAILEKCADVMTVRHDDTLSVKALETGDDVELARRAASTWSKDEIEPFERLRRRVVV